MQSWANAISSGSATADQAAGTLARDLRAKKAFHALGRIAEHTRRAKPVAGDLTPESKLLPHRNLVTHRDEVVTITFDSKGAWDEGKRLVRLRLLPHLSNESVAFLREAGSFGCAGELYRSESFLVQGRIRCHQAMTKVVKAPCPAGTVMDAHRVCPPHDPKCGCHGPIMTRGMVGWAGGSAGPDFFIYTGDAPATHWAHDHTVFAIVEDDESWATLGSIRKLPARSSGMTLLVTPLPLTVGVES